MKENKINFWGNLKRENPSGIFALAPMADVTDNPFRKILTEVGRPTVFFTEFVAVDGLVSEQGRQKLIDKLLIFDTNQKPIIAQIFGGKPENFSKAAKICRELEFDGIDINMGCPQKNIIKQKAGANLITDFQRAKKIFLETKKGAGDLEVSVKTRIGFKKIDLEWIEEILAWKPNALTVHLRTQKEMSKVSAHWELMTEIRELRDKISPETILIGNGDIEDLIQAKEKISDHQIDGVMIGRGIFKNPFLFAEKSLRDFSASQKINLALKHAKYFQEEKQVRNFNFFKKFLKIYINDFTGAKELRTKLMTTKNLTELEKICYNLNIKKNKK